jgi:hypothetical protein
MPWAGRRVQAGNLRVARRSHLGHMGHDARYSARRASRHSSHFTQSWTRYCMRSAMPEMNSPGSTRKSLRRSNARRTPLKVGFATVTFSAGRIRPTRAAADCSGRLPGPFSFTALRCRPARYIAGLEAGGGVTTASGSIRGSDGAFAGYWSRSPSRLAGPRPSAAPGFGDPVRGHGRGHLAFDPLD